MGPNWMLVCILGLCALARVGQAAIYEYNDVVLPANALMFRRSGMYAPNETPENKGMPAFIKVDLTLHRKDPEYHGETMKVQLAVLDQYTWDHKLGVKTKNRNGQMEQFFCCTAELVASGECDEPLTLILEEDPSRDVFIHTIEFKPTKEKGNETGPVRIDRTFPVNNKALKYILFSSCNDLTQEVVINGKTEWRNPYGYLPGELFGFLSFFSRVAIIYIILGIVWAIACARHWKELMILQNYVTVVLALGMMEMALRYYDFAQFNRTGARGTALIISSSILHTLKQTVSRLLVLIVSMGFGIVKPTLGDSFNTIAALGGLYFFFSAVQRIYELSSHTSAITFMQYVTMLPVAALDLVFFIWTFRSLGDVISQLESREQGAKLALYQRFRRILVSMMVLASIWSLAYLFIVVSGRINEDWESRWIFDGFFDGLYLLVLVSIMILWRPTNNSMQFAYQRVANRDLDDEEYGNGLADEDPEVSSARKGDDGPERPSKSEKQSTNNGVELSSISEVNEKSKKVAKD